jgi:ADP-ribosylglycohydrolase
MIGAIIGDMVGSRFERRGQRIKTKEFDLFTDESHFTDDTVMSIATADCLLNDPELNYTYYYQKWGRLYFNCGFGGFFKKWVISQNPTPYNSYGNGSAMRVSPVAYAYNSLDEIIVGASKSAEVTHNHPEGMKGAQATATAIFMAKSGTTKEGMRILLESTYGYDLQRHSDQIRESYGFDVTCQGSVPEAIISFLDSENFEDAIRIAVSLGGDSDTIACITGSIAESYYKEIPEWIVDAAKAKLTKDLLLVYNDFNRKYGCR